MIDFLAGRASERKLRLYACAAVRRIWRLLFDARSRTAVVVAEKCADGLASREELCAAMLAAQRVILDLDDSTEPHPDVAPGGAAGAERAARYAAGAAKRAAAADASEAVEAAGQAEAAVGSLASRGLSSPDAHKRLMEATDAEMAGQMALIHCIFADPFHPVPFSVAWRTETVLALAQQMYEAHDFSAMPILADALQDAGCDSAEVLDHCRALGPHVCGCWVVDLVLGRE
jgi:hypothetical protein